MKRCFWIFVVGLMLQSCLDDDVVFPEVPVDVGSNSISIVTLLDRISNEEFISGGAGTCFEFTYPITLSYNTGSTISIGDNAGLMEASKSQSPGLHVTGISFPFSVNFDANELSISNDEAFLDLLLECELGTFHNDFDTYFLRCFDLQYPVELLSEDTVPVNVNDKTELQNFLIQQGPFYQPLFQFPVEAVEINKDVLATIEDYYGFYRLFDRCKECPLLFFDFEAADDGINYFFFGEFQGMNDITYQWEIFNQNGETIFTEREQPGGDNFLAFQFEPGVYDVCIKAETAPCPEGVSYCQRITAEVVCGNAAFEPVLLDEGYYEFRSNIVENDAIFTWFIDDTVVPNQRENRLKYNFLSDSVASGFGNYNVCFEVTTPFCPETREYCEVLPIRESCLDLFFETERDGFTSAYSFFADFPLMNEIQYQWVVKQEGMLIADEIEEPGGDNQFFFQFSQGVYEVCLFAETVECSESLFCQKIIVN